MLYVHCVPFLFLEQTPVALNVLSVLSWQQPVHTNKRTLSGQVTRSTTTTIFFAKNELISMLKRWICKRHYAQTGNSCFHTSKERNAYFKHWICEIGLNVYIIDFDVRCNIPDKAVWSRCALQFLSCTKVTVIYIPWPNPIERSGAPNLWTVPSDIPIGSRRVHRAVEQNTWRDKTRSPTDDMSVILKQESFLITQHSPY